MILLIATKADITVDAVVKYLKEYNAPFIRLNLEDFPQKASLVIHADEKHIDGSILLYDMHEIKLSEITACWYRHATLTIPSKEDGLSKDLKDKQYRAFAKTERNAFLSSLWKFLSDRFWINYPPLAQISEGKLSNLHLAQELGFEIPKTLFTTDAQAAKDFFYACDGNIVIKVLEGRVVTKNRKEYVVFTTLINEEDLDRIDSVKYTPTFFQEYIPKKVELRVTVVGKQIFACEIHSQDSEKTKIDWRHFDFANVKHQKHKLPNEISEKLLKFMEIRKLSYGCFDLILTPDDRYVFIEINPSGEYLWTEELANLPISRTIAELLIKGSKERVNRL